LTVDKLEARLVVMEAKLGAKDVELETKVTNQQAEITALQLHNADLQNKVGTYIKEQCRQ
jgi:hypothetical protein